MMKKSGFLQIISQYVLIFILSCTLLLITGCPMPEDEEFIEYTKELTVYWSFGHEINKADIMSPTKAGDTVVLITDDTGYAYGMAIDVINGKMYWVDSGNDQIRRADLDGNNSEVLVSSLYNPMYIALDVQAGKMYWSAENAAGSGKIQRANLDGTELESDFISTGQSNNPIGIALKLSDPKMVFWCWYDGIADDDVITKAEISTPSVHETLITGLGFPYGMDFAGEYLYWTDRSTGKVQRVHFDGTNADVEDIVTNLDDPHDVAVDLVGEKVYWIDFPNSAGRIRRANLDGTEVEELLTPYQANGIALERSAGN